MDFLEYIKPELLILVPVLYVLIRFLSNLKITAVKKIVQNKNR